MHRRLALLLIAAATSGLGCKSKSEPARQPPGPGSAPIAAPVAPDAAAPAPAMTGLDVGAIDKSVKPGDDFFRYANGAWEKATEIPADRSSYGTGAVVSERTQKRVQELIVEATKAPAGSEARKIGDFYTAFMDEAGIEAKGIAPLVPPMAAIEAIASPGDLSEWLGGTVAADVDAINSTDMETPNIFGLWVAQDFSEPTKYSPFLLQGGLGLPDRDYYTSKAPRMVELRAKYLAHVTAMLTLAKIEQPAAKAKAVVALETKIAATHATRAQSGDVKRGLVRWNITEFPAKAPGMDWARFFSGMPGFTPSAVVVWHPSAITGVAALVKSESLSTWKSYLTYHLIAESAAFLPKAFADESFAFFGGAIAGTPTQKERWKRAIDATNAAMGEAIGKLYVAKYFPASEKARAQAMVQKILEAFGKRVDNLAWMSAATKAKAKAKLAVLKVGVGYPDTWRDFTELEVKTDEALQNAWRADGLRTDQQIAKLDQPVNRDEWVMTPHLVNAVNLPAMNAMNFPAGILQPPFFDPTRPEIMDYGAIGAVIGHEISHSFDDQGALFDATGRLENWWTKEDFAHFAESGTALAKQYSAYKPFPDLALDGKQLLSENIADVAGLSAAYDAAKLLGAPDWEGFTADQQFFLSFAQMWRTKYREAALRAGVITGVHAPGPYRSATVRNLDAWYAAFDVKPGEARYLAPADRVRVW